MGSAQVSWWDVHDFVAPVLARAGEWPIVGTPEWCAMPVDHPAKIAAVFDAARHWALRVETCQTALAEASRAVSAAEDWSGIANQISRRCGVYRRREVA
ncbi:MAG TPA: DUF2742 domain-containing protein [Mycobacterium sp.]|nr:DUF2742 domain-containing protein [Mycobacterium sp.]HUH70030.1 DUF2742 domain-containing protein [Mycobacterium sp.]